MHYYAEVVCQTGRLTASETADIARSLDTPTPVINEASTGTTRVGVTIPAAAVAQAALDALASVAAVVDSPIIGLHVVPAEDTSLQPKAV